MSPNLTISVVIPTYNRCARLPRVLEPILADAYAREVIVVVDGSDDGTLALLQETQAKEPRLRPVWQDNAGAAAARQRGLTEATSDVVLFLDDDVVAGRGLVSKHAAIHARMSGTVVVGYTPIEVAPGLAAGDVATRLYARDYERHCREYEADPGSILKRLWAGNMSLPRAAAVAAGMVTRERLDYHEDLEFGIRCAAIGLRGHFDRNLVAIHLHERSLDAFTLDCRRQGRARKLLHDSQGSSYDGAVRGSIPNAIESLSFIVGRSKVAVYLARFLMITTRIAVRLNVLPVAMLCLRLLRQIEIGLGYSERSGSAPVS